VLVPSNPDTPYMVTNHVKGLIMKLENATKEQLLAVAKAALALSTKMVDTEEMVTESRSSFEVEDEWEALTASLSAIK